jgi:hypothetical protein
MWDYMVPILIFSVPIVAILGGVAKRWIAMKEKEIGVAAQVAGEQAAQYAAKIATLEERVAVLNRIVTDRNEGLTAQIEGLRDAPPLSAKDKIN